MGIKDELVKIAISKVSEKILEHDKVDGAINSLVKTAGKYNGVKFTEDYIKESRRENHIIIQKRSMSSRDIISVISGKTKYYDDVRNAYQVCNLNGEIKYSTYMRDNILASLFLCDRYITSLYDVKDEKIGEIKELIFNIGDPFERKVKKCDILLNGKKVCRLKKSEQFKVPRYFVLSGNIEINNISKDRYLIIRNGKDIATIIEIPFSLKDGYADKFFIEYNNKRDTRLVTIIAIAIDVLNKK